MRRGHGTLGFLSKSAEFDGKKKTCAFARCKKLQKNAQEYEKKGNKGQGIDDRVSEGVVCAPPQPPRQLCMIIKGKKFTAWVIYECLRLKDMFLLFGKSKLRKISIGGNKSGIKLPHSTWSSIQG